MDFNELTKPLEGHEIEFRVQSVNNGGYATILAYKDARTDMNRLDKVCGQLNWKREHSRDNRNCVVSIWDENKGQWISKEDTGSESNTEAQKGLASDSFKRACFNWGIGRELYDYPVMSIKLNPHEINEKNGKKYTSWGFKLKEWKWYSEFDGSRITFLAAKDDKGKVRFQWGERK